MARPKNPHYQPPDPNEKPMKRARRRKYEPPMVPTNLTELVKLLDKTAACWPSVRSIENIRAAASGARDLIQQEESQVAAKGGG